MKIALVHDYLNEFGGAERVLRVLSEMYPQAPIYTAFQKKNSPAGKAFDDREIRESKWAWLLRIDKLYSPLRFLAPTIWSQMDLREFDLVITSASWYISRGFKVGPKTKVICYCHTPPRYLYGYQTSVNWQKYFVVRLYATLVNHYLRLFDYRSAQTVDKFIVNSRNVQQRVKKFYRRDSKVIYPPIEVDRFSEAATKYSKQDYYLIVSRLVGAKGLEEAARAANNLGFKLKIAGAEGGLSQVAKNIKRLGGEQVELLGRVEDDQLARLYAEAKGFIALAREEDFGMTVVEAMAAGTPVIAFNGGGFRESVMDGKTGVLIDDTDVATLEKAIKKFESIRWSRKKLQAWAREFSRDRFEAKIKQEVSKLTRAV
jgi:glycosyltransferase involved in cell wall biosynthesis